MWTSVAPETGNISVTFEVSMTFVLYSIYRQLTVE